MSNHIWTADGRIVEIDVTNKKTENLKNVIEPFTLFNFKDEKLTKEQKEIEEKKQKTDKRILFIKPNSNKTLGNLCFYRDVFKDGTVGEFNNPPILEITGSKCQPNQTKNSTGMFIDSIRSVNNLKGSSTLRDKNGLECVLDRKKINDSYLNSLYFGDCLKDPLYWTEEKNENKIKEYNDKLITDKISNYIPKLVMPKDTSSLHTSKYPEKRRTVLELDHAFKSSLTKDSKDAIASVLNNDDCLGGTSDVQKQEKTKSFLNSVNKFFNKDISEGKFSGRDGINVNLYGTKCPESSNSYFGIDVQFMETTDAKGNVRTFKLPIYNESNVISYHKDEKCEMNISELDPLLKNALVGDCDNPPTALKRVKSSKHKDNYIPVYDDRKYETKQIISTPRRPGLAGYDIKLEKPQCNSTTKKIVDFQKEVSKCGK
jgi:hypothetical protein